MNPLPPGTDGAIPPYLQKLLPPASRRFGVFGDTGTCLFHAIATAITGRISKRAGYRLRARIAADTDEEKWRRGWRSYNFKTPPVDLKTFQRKMNDVGVWADMDIIPYIMWYLNLNLNFFDDTQVYCGVQYYDENRPNVFIMWVRKSHFEPVLTLEANKWSGIYGDDVARKIATYYANTCRGFSRGFFTSLIRPRPRPRRRTPEAFPGRRI
mgnify:CR=1 FL=1|jgi:hypothetical protein